MTLTISKLKGTNAVVIAEEVKKELEKYKGQKEAGLFLGRLLGSRIKQSQLPAVDIIVPVPLHPIRYRRRGFNQSKIIADGVAEILEKPVVENALLRMKYTSTQTRRNRYERWQNVEGIFVCPDLQQISFKHILLIDDVITTGATLEAAGNALLKSEGVKLSIASAAYTTT